MFHDAISCVIFSDRPNIGLAVIHYKTYPAVVRTAPDCFRFRVFAILIRTNHAQSIPYHLLHISARLRLLWQKQFPAGLEACVQPKLERDAKQSEPFELPRHASLRNLNRLQAAIRTSWATVAPAASSSAAMKTSSG